MARRDDYDTVHIVISGKLDRSTSSMTEKTNFPITRVFTADDGTVLHEEDVLILWNSWNGRDHEMTPEADVRLMTVLDKIELLDVCPDGGKCHHLCTQTCWRVSVCEPLSGVYPNDEWPRSVKP